MRKSIVFGLVGVVVAALLAWRVLGHQTPKGQAPLTNLTQDTLGKFESDFNRSADEIRVLVLLSPT
jgi:hypothetical protein